VTPIREVLFAHCFVRRTIRKKDVCSNISQDCWKNPHTVGSETSVSSTTAKRNTKVFSGNSRASETGKKHTHMSIRKVKVMLTCFLYIKDILRYEFFPTKQSTKQSKANHLRTHRVWIAIVFSFHSYVFRQSFVTIREFIRLKGNHEIYI
jgi:hypothetical protein